MTGIDDSLAERIRALVAKHAGVRVDEISLETRLGEDLRIVGDDAEELLTEFSQALGVDMSACDCDAYFPSEVTSDMHFYLGVMAKEKSSNPLMRFLRSVETCFWGLFAKRTKYETVTVRDLVESAQAGKWLMTHSAEHK